MDDLIQQAEKHAGKFDNVDLRGILRNAFIVEDGLHNFLHEHCQCDFVEMQGKFGIISTGGDDAGCHLMPARLGVTFDEMLHIALKRYKAP
jgi:hypothetical protein